MDLTKYKIIMDYAEQDMKRLDGSKKSCPERYEKAVLNWRRSKMVFIGEMNLWISDQKGGHCGKDYIVFETPDYLDLKNNPQ